jgi:hypothetical protein
MHKNYKAQNFNLKSRIKCVHTHKTETSKLYLGRNHKASPILARKPPTMCPKNKKFRNNLDSPQNLLLQPTKNENLPITELHL